MSATEQPSTADGGSVCKDLLGPLPEPAAFMSEDGNRLAFYMHRDYTRPLVTLAQAHAMVSAERERCAGGNDLEAVCEAFHRLIEAHAQRSPFHQPVCADAQTALRVLRGVVSALRA